MIGALLSVDAYGQTAAGAISALQQFARGLPADSESVQQLGKSLQILGSLYGRPDVKVAPEYVRSLEVNAELLRKSKGERVSVEERSAIIADVAADLSFMSDFALSVPQLGGLPPTTVQVTVVTTKSNSRVDGYQIAWNKLRYPSQHPLFSFDKPTSPSEGLLAPGRYIMLVIKAGQPVLSLPKEIGLRGQRRVDVVQPLD
jgi:hypothetical protein